MEDNFLIQYTSLSVRTKDMLMSRLGIMTVGELRKLDYNDLEKVKGIGAVTIQEVLDFVHDCGFSLLNEEGPYSDLEKKIMASGKKTLSCYDFSKRLCQALYQNDIFTLDDLIQYGERAYTLDSLTGKLRGELRARLIDMNIILPKEESRSVKNLKTLKQLMVENYPSSKKMEWLERRIDIMELDDLEKRFRYILYQNQVYSLYDLLQCTEKDLLSFSNMGKLRVIDLELYLKGHGLSLKSDVVDEEIIEKEVTDLLQEYHHLLDQKHRLNLLEKKIDTRLLKVKSEIDAFELKQSRIKIKLKK